MNATRPNLLDEAGSLNSDSTFGLLPDVSTEIGNVPTGIEIECTIEIAVGLLANII